MLPSISVFSWAGFRNTFSHSTAGFLARNVINLISVLKSLKPFYDSKEYFCDPCIIFSLLHTFISRPYIARLPTFKDADMEGFLLIMKRQSEDKSNSTNCCFFVHLLGKENRSIQTSLIGLFILLF